jgi:YD repeat-containing protein
LVDPVGNRQVTYQTDRGRVLSSAAVLSASFGDVFSDTAQQNGVVNVTLNQYDGLDRLTQTTLPEGGITAYTYATSLNLWANNVASVTQTAKPGSPLSPLTTSVAYHPLYNRPTSVTDPLGLVTTLTYDALTGNLARAVADAGGAGHFSGRGCARPLSPWRPSRHGERVRARGRGA